MLYVSVLDQKKIQNLMRKGGKKTSKKTIEPIFERVIEGDLVKKHWINF